MKLRVMLLSVLAASASSASAAPPNMQPGLWEITMKTEMAGMPMQMPAQTMRHCYRKEDIKQSKDALPADKNCKVDGFSESGNTVRWKATCRMEGSTMVGNGEMTFAGAAYTGSMTMTGDMQGQKMNMTQKYSGKRVGDCK